MEEKPIKIRKHGSGPPKHINSDINKWRLSILDLVDHSTVLKSYEYRSIDDMAEQLGVNKFVAYSFNKCPKYHYMRLEKINRKNII